MSKNELKTGKDFYIALGGAACPVSVATIGINVTITNETEKAVELTAYTSSDKPVRAWLPRKAIKAKKIGKTLTDMGCEGELYELARWFKPTGWTARWMEITTQHAVL